MPFKILGPETTTVPCPTCGSAQDEPCTAPTATGRAPMRGIHFARVPRESYPSRYGFGTPDATEGFGAAL